MNMRQRVIVRFEPAGDGGWYCYDDRTFDGTNEYGYHPREKHLALADLLEKLEDA